MADKVMLLGGDPPSRAVLQTILAPLGLSFVHPDQFDAAEAVNVIDARRDPSAGLAALQCAKAQTTPPPVLVLASAEQQPEPHAAWAAGADGYLTDPFDPDELRSFVSRLAGEVAAAP